MRTRLLQSVFATALFGVIFAVSPVFSSGNTYYVTKTGLDTNPCSLSQPCLTIAQGVKKLSPGDTLYVDEGEWSEIIQTTASSNMRIPSGTSWDNATRISAMPAGPNDGPPYKPVVLKRWDSTSRVRFTGGDNQRPGGIRYIVIEGFHVIGGGYPVSINTEGGNSGTSADAPDHIRLVNMEIEGGSNSGIIVNHWSSSNEFIGLHVHDNGDSGGDHGVYMGGSYHIIRGGKWHDNSGYQIQLYHNASQDPYALPGGEGVGGLVEGVEVYRTERGNSGIVISQYMRDYTLRNSVIYGLPGIALNLGTGQHALNNTIMGKLQLLGTTNTSVVRNNLALSIAKPNGAAGAVIENNLILPLADYGFVDGANGDFRLLPDSPAVNVGLTLPEIEGDFDGVPRPQEGVYDIGAFEYQPPLPEQLLSSVSALVADSGNFRSDAPASNLFDGLTRDYLVDRAGNSKISSFWVILDMQYKRSLTRARIFGDAIYAWESFTWSLSISDSIEGPFTAVFTNSDCHATQWFEESLDEVQARFVKVEVFGPGRGTEAREIEVYGR
jgi:hypothetical protein